MPEGFFELTTTAMYEDGKTPTVTVSTQVKLHPECPPALVTATMEALGKFVAETQSEETAMAIAQYMVEAKARRQRQADAVARQLLDGGKDEED